MKPLWSDGEIFNLNISNIHRKQIASMELEYLQHFCWQFVFYYSCLDAVITLKNTEWAAAVLFEVTCITKYEIKNVPNNY